ncbi:putative mitochondrial carrier protein [Talaromyces proteolyticus]|uniref:Mitochondrial carrier protein n=1 Tax=Talaromyces proteolyticus TaxID=1131652 RepID=A0AAD4KIE4_9EURO|nr:putative mitochondrial carrier protein [Talaromyces proteolyticus]KAH8691098.1 putative mitochondrial carrier protein [Talaromyces proteolyticus]
MAVTFRSTFDQEPLLDNDKSRQNHRNNAATAASAAGTRAFSAQLVAFYFRAPVKSFFRTRAYARAINPRVGQEKWSLHTTTPGLLAHAVRLHGWKFLPNQVLPLYSPILPSTFIAGLSAGAIQSVIAAPLDALQVRLHTSGMLEGHYRSMWDYGWTKLREIGVRGVFAGWTLSFLRDSFGYGLFFASFEYVKSQAYLSYVTWYYGYLHSRGVPPTTTSQDFHGKPTIKPHYTMELCFLMGAGVTASFVQQFIQHPLGIIQDLHCGRLEYLDRQLALRHSRSQVMEHYYHAYQATFRECQKKANRAGGWLRWLYRGFVRQSIRQVPSTSAGLVIFELMRRKYASAPDAVLIEKDGFNILMT